MPGLVQGTAPVPHPGKGVSFTTGIKQDKRHRDLVEMQLVNESVARLARQVPEEDFAYLLAVTAEIDFMIVECPDVTAMSRSSCSKRLPGKDKAKRRLTHTRITDQDDPRISVLN